MKVLDLMSVSSDDEKVLGYIVMRKDKYIDIKMYILFACYK